MGNRGIWFGTIFPYMVMVGTRGIWFSAITRYCRCCFTVQACSLPFFYLVEPMCIVHMGNYSCTWSNIGKDIKDPDRKSINSYRTVHSSITHITPVGHSIKCSGLTTVHMPAPSQIKHHDSQKEYHNDIRPENSESQTSKSSTILSNVLNQFDD